MSEQSAEIAQSEVRNLTTVEFGIRDFGGEIVTLPDWRSPADVVDHLHGLGYAAVTSDDVLARTTTTTVTTTDWEAAR